MLADTTNGEMDDFIECQERGEEEGAKTIAEISEGRRREKREGTTEVLKFEARS